MELTPHLEAIRADLESLLGADEGLATAYERMARPVEATLQLRLLDVLGDGALELTEQLPTGHAELRVAGRDARVVYVGPPEAPPAIPTAGGTDEDDGGMARLTVRMPDALKGAIEAAAAAGGRWGTAWLPPRRRRCRSTRGSSRRHGRP